MRLLIKLLPSLSLSLSLCRFFSVSHPKIKKQKQGIPAQNNSSMMNPSNLSFPLAQQTPTFSTGLPPTSTSTSVPQTAFQKIKSIPVSRRERRTSSENIPGRYSGNPETSPTLQYASPAPSVSNSKVKNLFPFVYLWSACVHCTFWSS